MKYLCFCQTQKLLNGLQTWHGDKARSTMKDKMFKVKGAISNGSLLPNKNSKGCKNFL